MVNKGNITEIKKPILNHKIIGIFGKVGCGKTSLIYVLGEMFKEKKEVYIFKHPKPKEVEKLGYKILYSFEELEDMEDICLIIDEPQLHLPVYNGRSNDKFCKLASLCRQRNITLILATSDTRYVDKKSESYMDGWFIKDLDYDLVKRGGVIKNIIRRNALIDPSGFKMKKNKFLYSNTEESNLEGKYEFEEEDFFDESLSKAYSNKNFKKCDTYTDTDSSHDIDNIIPNVICSATKDEIQHQNRIEKTIENLFKKKCNDWVTKQIRKGNFKLEKCEECGCEDINILIPHHKQYTSPFTLKDIKVLCRSCHNSVHYTKPYKNKQKVIKVEKDYRCSKHGEEVIPNCKECCANIKRLYKDEKKEKLK